MSSARSNTILKYGLYLIILLPLAFTPFTFFPWHYGKTIIFQIIVEVLVVFYLAMVVKANGRSLLQFKKLNFLDWSILLFLFILTLTALTGVNPSNSFWGNQARANGVFTWWHFGAFYFLLKYYFRNSGRSIAKEDGRNSPPIRGGLGGGLLTTAVLVAALASLTSLFPNLLPTTWQAASGGGIIGNRAFLASYLVLAIGLSLYLFVNYLESRNVVLSSRPSPDAKIGASGGISLSQIKGIPRLRFASLGMTKMIFICRWLFLAAPVLFLYAIIDTGNRGALIGLMMGIWLGLLISLFVLRTKKIKIIILILFLLLNSLFLILYSLRQNPTFQRVLPRLSNLANISFSSGTSETRLMAWQSAWQGIKERPVQGWGWGNYGVVFDKYYNPQFLKHSFAETVWDKPHNWLLEIGVTAGILGVLGYLAIYISAFYYLLKKNIVVVETHCNASLQRCGKIILSAALLAYFVTGLFLFETTNSLILWFLILAMISSSVVETNGRSSLQSQSQTKIFNICAKGASASGGKYLIFFVFFLALCYFYYLPSLRSSYYMRLAERETALMDWKEDAVLALSFKTPFKTENAVFLAEQFTKFDKAEAIIKNKEIEEMALKIVEVLYNSSKKYPENLSFPVWAGQILTVLGDKEAERYFELADAALYRAREISPRKQEVLFLMGRLYLLEKNFDKAVQVHQKAVELSPQIGVCHWFLGLAYVASGDWPAGLAEIEKAVELGYNLTADQKLYVFGLYALEKNYPKLIEEYKKLIEQEPENVNWYIKLAAVYAEAGDKKAALEITRQVINLYPPIKAEAEKFIEKYKLDED